MEIQYFTKLKAGGHVTQVIFYDEDQARAASDIIHVFKDGSKNATLCKWLLNGPYGFEAQARIEHALEILCRGEASADKDEQVRKALNGHETKMVRVFVDEAE